MGSAIPRMIHKPLLLDVERTVTMNLTKNSKNCCFIRHLIDFLFRKIILMQKSFFGTNFARNCDNALRIN